MRADFRLSEKFESFLNNIGSPLFHRRKGELKLRDIFIFPDLTVRSQGKSSLRNIRGEDIVKYTLNCDRIIFQSPALGGKTSLAKILFSEILSTAEIVPLLLDGREITTATEARAESMFWKKFSEQYSSKTLERFQQWEKGKRALLVDNWHRTELNPEGRKAFLEVAGRHFGRILLFADDFFQLQELIEKAPSTMLEFDHATIEQFRHTLRGRIIDRWVSLGQEHTGDVKKISREIEEKENLVRSLIGKNVLPSLPFVILCILEADQEGKAQSGDAGSFGYLYEVLVTTALNSTKGAKAQLEKKYIFLGRLAYHMFKIHAGSLSLSEVRRIAEEYSTSHLVTLDIDSMLGDLEDTRVLVGVDGNYSFAYRHLFYYFVARYYKDNLDRQGGSLLRDELALMADQVSSDENSAVLMFVMYFARDSAQIIGKLVRNANRIYQREEPANLDSDVRFLSQFCDEPDLEIPQDIDTAANREERRKFRDRIERTKERLIDRESRSFTYSEELSDKDKFDLAHRHIELLGQIIRNFPGSLPANEKLEILEACYLLGLRMIRALLRLIEASTPIYRDALLEVRQKLKEKSAEEIRKLVDSLIIVMARICVIGTLKKVSGSVGIADLEQAYRETLARVGKTNATQLINLSIKLDHFQEFPDTYIRELHRLFNNNPFADTILSDLVVGHMMIIDLDRKTKESMASLFKIKQNIPQLVDRSRKH